ncbi:MAG: hypothetical protein KKE94_09040 [Gammaproteobacteria bacterium]|nr:hypothetical protein [Gammaproteobacteria bacterium]
MDCYCAAKLVCAQLIGTLLEFAPIHFIKHAFNSCGYLNAALTIACKQQLAGKIAGINTQAKVAVWRAFGIPTKIKQTIAPLMS